MGLFSKDRGVKRAMEKVVNKHAQSVDRWSAIGRGQAPIALDAAAAFVPGAAR